MAKRRPAAGGNVSLRINGDNTFIRRGVDVLIAIGGSSQKVEFTSGKCIELHKDIK